MKGVFRETRLNDVQKIRLKQPTSCSRVLLAAREEKLKTRIASNGWKIRRSSKVMSARVRIKDKWLVVPVLTLCKTNNWH